MQQITQFSLEWFTLPEYDVIIFIGSVTLTLWTFSQEHTFEKGCVFVCVIYKNCFEKYKSQQYMYRI